MTDVLAGSGRVTEQVHSEQERKGRALTPKKDRTRAGYVGVPRGRLPRTVTCLGGV